MLGSIALVALWTCGQPQKSDDATTPKPSEAHSRRSYRTVVRGRPSSRQRQLDRQVPGFTSVVDLERPGARARDGLTDTLAQAPGVQVRSLGGLGQFSSLSIRGSSPQQVGLFLDGIPVSNSLAGLMDLSELPTEGLSRVEIHRGYIPIAFGAAALGGAINLVSASAQARPKVTAEAGLGSWWTRQVRAHALWQPHPSMGVGIHVGYAGTQGNFPYLDTRGTPTLTGDDRQQRRAGNGYDRVLVQTRFDARVRTWTLGTSALVAFKHQGLPGTASAQAYAARQTQVLARGSLSLTRTQFARPGTKLQWLLGIGTQLRRFQDPRGELGVGVDDQHSTTVDSYLSPRWRTALWRNAFVTVVADTRGEWISVDQRSAPAPRGDARRWRLAVGFGAELEQYLLNARLQIVPAFRWDGVYSAFAVPQASGEQDDQGRRHSESAWSPRMGVRLALTPALSLRTSIGRYFRMPTLMELFGDRGWFVGNEGLAAERGTMIDGGVVVDTPDGRLYGQVAGFYTRSRDLIQWISAGSVARPENVSAAMLAGVDSVVALHSKKNISELSIRYTWLHAEDRSDNPTRNGRALPGRPQHDLWLRSSFGYPWTVRGTRLEPRLSYTLEYVAQNYLDPSGRYKLPPRLLQTLGVEAQIGAHVFVSFDIRNLLDVRTTTLTTSGRGRNPISVPVTDYIGYPLPGRSLWATIRVDFGLDRRRRHRSIA